MAEQRATVELRCTVCLELFKEPKLLPCCHTFCKSCLEGILEKSEVKEKLVCPQCRGEHEVPSNGAAGFLNDYTVETLPHTLSKPTSVVCESCDSNGEAVAYCHDCEDHLCKSCVSSHKAIKFLKGHKVEKLSSSEEPIVLPKKAKTIYCSIHPRKELELYCLTCQRVVCTLCVVTSHNKHEFGNISSDTRQAMETQIKEYMTQVNEKFGFFGKKLAYTKEVENKKISEQVKLKEEVKTFFDSLVSTIETQKATLFEQIETNSNQDLKKIWAEKDILGTFLTASESALQFAERSLQCINDVEFLLIGAQLKDRLQQLSKAQWDQTTVESIELTTQEFIAQTLSNLTTQKIIKSTLPQEFTSSQTNTTDPVIDTPVIAGRVMDTIPASYNSRGNYTTRPVVTNPASFTSRGSYTTSRPVSDTTSRPVSYTDRTDSVVSSYSRRKARPRHS